MYNNYKCIRVRFKKTKVWKDEILDSRRRLLTHLFCSRLVSYKYTSPLIMGVKRCRVKMKKNVVNKDVTKHLTIN